MLAGVNVWFGAKKVGFIKQRDYCEPRVYNYTVKPRKSELRLLEILAKSNLISDTMDLEYRAYLWTLFITVYQKTACMFWVRKRNVSWRRFF